MPEPKQKRRHSHLVNKPSLGRNPNTQMKPLRIALIGAGARSNGAHYSTLKRLPNVEIVAIADSDKTLAKNATIKYNIPAWYTNYTDMLTQEKPDAVYILMPPHTTYDVAATAIKNGSHIILKEPPGLTTEECRQLALLAKKHNVLSAVPFFRRFSSVVRQGKNNCQKHGTIHSAVATFYKHALHGKPYYNGAAEMWRCDAIHAVDTLRYLCEGEVESVASDVRTVQSSYRNMHHALVRFSSGATGVLLTNWAAGHRRFTVEIHASGISCFGDPENGGTLFANGSTTPTKTLSAEPADEGFGMMAMNHHIIDRFCKGQQPETSFEDALKTMALSDRIYQSQI
jgi:virulence factor